MTAIVGVHGVWNYHRAQTAEGLSEAWTRYLRSGYRGSDNRNLPEIEVAYYSPDLRSLVTQGGPDPEQLTPGVREMVASWLGNVEIVPGLDEGRTVSQGQLTVPIREGVERIARLLKAEPTLVRQFVAMFFGEVATYFDAERTKQRLRVQSIVRDAVGRNSPRVVIAHSLGAVITWETLMANPDLPTIDLMLTLGAPLAMPQVVFEKLTPSPLPGTKLPRPPQVKRWVSLADPGDLVAIVRPLSQFFDVDLELEPRIGAFKFHNVDGYLSDPSVAALVDSVLAP
ncbi:hypothetical protein [Microbacterium sp. P05]|uniref:hypothetical protein n=1 Tax=Microbacterium sp. P05 TaxID=3366948 RepID=UPI00374550D9